MFVVSDFFAQLKCKHNFTMLNPVKYLIPKSFKFMLRIQKSKNEVMLFTWMTDYVFLAWYYLSICWPPLKENINDNIK